MKVKLDKGAYLPERAYPSDAGLDLKSTIDTILWGGETLTIDTGVHMELPFGTVGMIKSRSGLNVKHSIQCEGVIDCDYRGSIKVKLYNHGNEGYDIHRGDKIAQLVILPVLYPELEQAEKLEPTERGEGGFGSTGR